MNNEITQTLADFVETARNDNFNLNITLTKFPELAQVDNQLLADFVETAKNDNFDLNVTFPKFPEITGQLEKPEEPGKTEDPTIYRGIPIVGSEQEPSATEEEVQEEQPDYLLTPIKDRDYSSFDTDEKKLAHQNKIRAERILTENLTHYSANLAKVPGYSSANT